MKDIKYEIIDKGIMLIVPIDASIPLSEYIYHYNKSLKDISNAFGKDKLIQVTKENILNNIPSSLANVFVQEKYFCIRNCGK